MIGEDIRLLILRGAIFVVNHSGGKDSQAMYLYLRRQIPDKQLLVIHAHLPDVDWDGIEDHIKATINCDYEFVRAGKTFFDMVEHRRMWPSPKNRQCTSDLKRGPIEKAVRRVLKQRGCSIVVNCMGIRAQESPGRAKAAVFKYDNRNSKAGREWYNWLPIHSWSKQQVFFEIETRSRQRAHWAYYEGMTRLSCCFCIMASKQDLQTAARLKPDLFDKYCELERQIDHTFLMPTNEAGRKFLPEIID